MGPIFGDNADKFRDYYISRRTTSIFEGYGGRTYARRLPLDFGLYGITLGQGPYELLSDYMFWRTDDFYNPRGPSLNFARWADNMRCGGKTCVGRFVMGIVDNLETQWYDEWPGNRDGFQFSGWGWHLNNGSFFGLNETSVGVLVARVVRTAENICNDIHLLKEQDERLRILGGHNPFGQRSERFWSCLRGRFRYQLLV